jgi:hypothetical protein
MQHWGERERANAGLPAGDWLARAINVIALLGYFATLSAPWFVR